MFFTLTEGKPATSHHRLQELETLKEKFIVSLKRTDRLGEKPYTKVTGRAHGIIGKKLWTASNENDSFAEYSHDLVHLALGNPIAQKL